ncbi:MAG: TraB/TrbI/VirB10 family type IV secretion system protein [Candidatus Sulfotelmatobacter sp.]|jgi:hypothetical protein
MKNLLTGTFGAVALLCGLAMAQDPTPRPTNSSAPQTQQNPTPPQAAPNSVAQASATPRIAPGSIIPVQLTKSIDAKKVKTGDEVDAKVTQDMKAGNGEVIVPKDTKVIGRVTEAQARSKEQKESQVGIAFDRAVLKSGGDVNLPMSIQAIISPSYLSANNNPGGENTGQAQSTGNPDGMPQGNGNARTGATGRSQAPTPTPSPGAAPTEDKTGNSAHPPITGNTQGVLGIPDLTLSSTAAPAQGSVLTSGKNNVKLESGTLMLLRVGTAPTQQ